MFRFILNKLVYLVPTFIGITIVAFAFVRVLPGDPVLLMAGERGVSPERHAELMAQLGFDRPIWQQYLDYVWNLLHGDFGQSLVTKKPVLVEFFALFPATVELSICAIIVAILLGIPAGVIAAVKRGSWFDQGLMGISLVGYSMPIFWWALLLIILFSGVLQWTPVSGRISLLYFFPPVTGFMLIDSLMSDQKGAFASAVSHLILPTIVLATIRNAMIPVITTIGLQVGVLMAGAILTETIFSWPGIGKWMLDSIFRRDYPVVQSGLLLIAFIIMLVNLVVDLLYGLINPRIRHK